MYAIALFFLNYGVFIMSESENQIEEKKKSPFGVIVGILFVLLLAVLGIGIVNNSSKTATSQQNTNIAALTDTNVTIETKEIVHVAHDEANNVTKNAVFDLARASTPRVLGNPNAPVRISEHSSFTCGHCANFHKTNFKQIKKDYVDTGKAYIVFNDFPLNAHDINIGMVTRCIPETAFFDFINLLFETQKSWLKGDYLKHIKQNAKLTGASDAQISNCTNSSELREALANQRKKAAEQHNVNSTPTLVINDNVVINGLEPYSKIKEALDAEFEKATK